MASQYNYADFILSAHPSYTKYLKDWLLAVKSYYGGVEYRNGRYLKAYDSDYSTSSEVINTYDVDEDGVQVGMYKSSVQRVNSQSDLDSEGGFSSNFYQEKLNNVPVFPYTRLYVSEYNAILFRSPPSRILPETPEVDRFLENTDGDGNSINEFMSAVDTFTTVFGVVWISCIKTAEAPYALWRMHKPTDVTNWKYSYSATGELTLNKIVIRIADEPDVEVFWMITPESIDTIFVPKDEDWADAPEGSEFLEDKEGKGLYRITQPNPLGYVPVRPVYQSTPISKGIGHTPIFDIAQIQRSVYGDMGEIYSAVSYGSHPVTVCDENTLNRNDNSVGAEPGSVIVTEASLNGQPNYVFEFVAPPLDSIGELRALIEQKIEKMNQVAMIRSEELIRASRSGAQIEQYDSKLEAFIRKKATSLEQAEFNLWKIWFDWQDQIIPDDVAISYNRLYNQKGVENEIKEMNTLIDAYLRYQEVFGTGMPEFEAKEFATEAEAVAEANRLGGTGYHFHEDEEGTVYYMPFNTHEEYELKMSMLSGQAMKEMPDFKEDLKERIERRLSQLIDSTYSDNSL